jgi:hypothetical protein
MYLSEQEPQSISKIFQSLYTDGTISIALKESFKKLQSTVEMIQSMKKSTAKIYQMSDYRI